MVPSVFSWFFKVSGCFSRFQVGFEGKSWLQVGFYSYRSVFIVRGRFFMDPGGFSCILWIQVCFHDSKLVFIVFQGFRLVFRGSRWVLRVNHGSRLVFIVTGRFL